jgi:peptidoglycan/LPS O-acetylase OafA/YrhL
MPTQTTTPVLQGYAVIEAPVAIAPKRAWTGRETYNLDFLRSVAVLCVLGRHVSGAFHDPYVGPLFQPQAVGIFGVLLFFVHTSLVLMMSLERHGGSFVSLYREFVIRRFFRIYPLAIVVILLSWFVLPGAASHVDEIRAAGQYTLKTLFGNLALAQNVFGVRYVNGVLWTLPLELQMYLMLPFVFVIGKRYGPRAIGLFVLPCALALAVLDLKLQHRLPQVLEFAPCFVAGVLCWCLPKPRLRLPFIVMPIALAAVWAFYSVGYGIVQSGNGAHVGQGEVPLGWPVCIVLGLILPCIVEMRSLLLKRVAKTVATYSYGVYLCHMPCIWLAFDAPFWQGPLWVRIAVLLVSLSVTCALCYHLVEQPGIKLGTSIVKRWKLKLAG